jgi:hypothetical protein
MPYFPIIGSGFDSDAQKQQYYAGLNAQIERQNADALMGANSDRNAYLFNAAQMRQQQEAQQNDAAMRAQAAAQQQYQFNAGMALDRQKAASTAAINLAKLKAGITEGAAEDKERATEKTEADSEKKQAGSFNQALAEIDDDTFDPANYSSLPPDQLAMLTRAVQSKRQSAAQNYFKAVNGANLLNKEQTLQDAIDAASKDKSTAPAFLAGLQKQLAAIQPAKPDEKTQDLLGIEFNSDTEKYMPPEAPSWLKSSQGATNKVVSPTGAPQPPAWLGGSQPPPAITPAPAMPSPAAMGVPRIRVRSPDGTIGTVPQSQLQDALSQGFTQLQ